MEKEKIKNVTNEEDIMLHNALVHSKFEITKLNAVKPKMSCLHSTKAKYSIKFSVLTGFLLLTDEQKLILNLIADCHELSALYCMGMC